MKKLGVLAILLVMALPSQAKAGEYLFNCKNLWAQDVLVQLPADSVDAARKILRTDKETIDKYSLDDNSRCAFRAELLHTKKKHTPKKPENVSPTE